MTTTPEQQRPTICIIDDHDVVHAGIRSWCSEATPPVHVAASYVAVDAFLGDHPRPSHPIDVVVLDLELRSREPAFDDLARIADVGYKVIVYSHIDHGEVILRCLDLGAVTYLVKSEGRRHLLDAIRSACTDTAFVGPRMAGAMCHDNRVGRPAPTKAALVARAVQDGLISINDL